MVLLVEFGISSMNKPNATRVAATILSKVVDSYLDAA